MKKIVYFILTVFLITSCNNKKIKMPDVLKKDNAESQKKVIGFSIDTLAIERWQRDLDVFTSKAKELGVDVIVQNAGNSMEEQKRQLMYLADINVDVLLVLPKVANALTDTLPKIRAKGIPVISYDRLIRDTDVDMYITINSERVGEIMAEEMLNRTTGKSWFCMLGPEEDFNMSLISSGVNKVLANTNVKIDYVYYTSGWDYDLAFQEMARLIGENKIPDAILCGNDAIAFSVIQAINQFYGGKFIHVCGQDADIAACQNITQGLQDFTVYKPITKLAELAAEYAVDFANGRNIKDMNVTETINNGVSDIPVVWLEPQKVDSSNIDKIIIDSGFHSYNEVYRIK